MNKYEMMFIIKATMEEANVKAAANNIKSLAESLNVKVESFKEMGQKKLAYPIKKEVSGYYFVMTMTANKDAIDAAGGGEGTTNYTELTNKPQINNIELIGNKSLDDLNIQIKGDYETEPITNAELENLLT